MSQEVVEAVFELSRWSHLSTDTIAEAGCALSDLVGKDFTFIDAHKSSSGLSVASFCHIESNLEFNLIPGGEALLGLSDYEYKAVQQITGVDIDVLSRLQPARTIKVEPFLLSRLPLLEKTVDQVIDVDWSAFRPDFQPLSGEETKDVPIYLSRSEVDAVISKYGLALPTEAQWEYAIRGGTNTPFYFGTELPDDRELGRIMDTDLRSIDDKQLAANPFGICGMLIGGWCRDSWFQERWTGRDNGPPHVVRGGAAIYWPWQGVGEWLLALSAMRRSADELEDQTCSAHVVRLLSD